MSCECKYKFDGRKCNSDQWCNNNICQCNCKKRHVCKKYYIWNPATGSCEKRKYLESSMDNSAIMCDEIIEWYNEETKTILTNFNEKYIACRT